MIAASSSFATQLPNSLLPVVAQSQITGTPVQSQTVYFTVSLKPRYPAELQAFCDSVSNPRSDNYRRWLTPEQVGLQFGASATTVNMVVNYLRSRGITITLQAPNRMAIMAKGTVAQVQSAFGTTIKNYSGPGQFGGTISFQANATSLNLPTNIAPQVVAVTGIQNWLKPYRAAQTQTLTPPLTRALYESAPAFALGFRGEGRTIAISNWDGFRLSNIPLFISAFNLPVPPGGPGSNIQVITMNGGSQNNGAAGEGDLDLQMELAVAPLATILDYDDGAGDLVAVLTKEGSDNLADAISESYGWGLGGFPQVALAAHNQHLAMSAQGQTYMAASGDTGTQWPQALPYPDADPEIMGVGGTIATVDSNTGARIDEVAWDGSGGGWTNSGFSFDRRPSWQTGSGVPSSPNARLVPDIGLQAGGPGAFVIYYNGSQVAFDGTSCSSPTNAAGIAIVEQRLANQGLPGRLGRLQDAIYLQNGRSDVWHDITQGSNGTLPNGQASNAGTNWDFCTGWGAPSYEGLYNSLLQQIVMTPYVPTAISTVLGTYLIGDPSSVETSDGIYYQIGSQAMSIGQGAGALVSFTVPDTTIAMSFDIQANAGVAGGTNMVWLYNWFTDNYDLVGACPMNATGSTDQVVKVRTSSVPNYIGPGGEVDAIVRGHLPIRPFNNQMPNPFTYKVDQLEVLVR